MAITLTYAGTTLALPDDLFWRDQHNWSPVEQKIETSITGAMLVDVAIRTAGRFITLDGDEEHAWMTYTVVSQLKIWAALPGLQMALSIQGTTYTVIFRHHEPPAVDLTSVVDYSTPDAQDYFYGQLKFMEV